MICYAGPKWYSQVGQIIPQYEYSTQCPHKLWISPVWFVRIYNIPRTVCQALFSNPFELLPPPTSLSSFLTHTLISICCLFKEKLLWISRVLPLCSYFLFVTVFANSSHLVLPRLSIPSPQFTKPAKPARVPSLLCFKYPSLLMLSLIHTEVFGSETYFLLYSQQNQ